jgi:hypothetical protein
MKEQADRMKEMYKNTSPAERSRKKRERQEQDKKEKNELHEMIMKEVETSMKKRCSTKLSIIVRTMIRILMNLTKQNRWKTSW